MLVKSLNNKQDWIQFHPSWTPFFAQISKKQYFQHLIEKIEKEYANTELCPKQKYIFRVFALCDLTKMKAIIFGQDPYHTPNVADGLAFSTPNHTKHLPPSLKNIFHELWTDLKINRFYIPDLSDWVQQGVLLINTILTVYAHRPNSCNDWGWNYFISDLINFLNQQQQSFTYVLLGKKAEFLQKYINTNKDQIIITSHPSPFSVHKGFFGSKIFSKINELLNNKQLPPIKW